jgi:hypothetical protein
LTTSTTTLLVLPYRAADRLAIAGASRRCLSWCSSYEWRIRQAVGAADALECARTDCSAYQDTIRTLYVVVPGLILLAVLAALEAGVRHFR